MGKIRVIQFGLGPIGIGTAKAVLEHPDMELVGAVDIDPEKVGLDVGSVLDMPGTGVLVKSTLEQEDAKADVAIHSTGSSLPAMKGQLLELLDAGLHVVSTCEELAWPWHRHPQEAETLDKVAKRVEKVIVGTGINPGFAMDLLPLVLANTTLDVRGVHVHRVLDAGKRRGPLQKKVGAGMEHEEFMALAREHKNGHAGFIESVAMIGAGLGWKLDDITDDILPMVAEEEFKTDYVEIAPGQVTGINQKSKGYIRGKEVISLHLQMYVGAPESFDYIKLDSNPPLELKIPGGLPGDTGTVSSTLTTIQRVMRSGATGLLSVKDLPASIN